MDGKRQGNESQAWLDVIKNYMIDRARTVPEDVYEAIKDFDK
tara:strand:- start:439 stop:564 length:126 start_codon:yes stop_codon:yes gene_type:complete